MGCGCTPPETGWVLAHRFAIRCHPFRAPAVLGRLTRSGCVRSGRRSGRRQNKHRAVNKWSLNGETRESFGSPFLLFEYEARWLHICLNKCSVRGVCLCYAKTHVNGETRESSGSPFLLFKPRQSNSTTDPSSPISLRNRARARPSRDITVPLGSPVRSANTCGLVSPAMTSRIRRA